jgi:hypothetical protein
VRYLMKMELLVLEPVVIEATRELERQTPSVVALTVVAQNLGQTDLFHCKNGFLECLSINGWVMFLR